VEPSRAVKVEEEVVVEEGGTTAAIVVIRHGHKVVVVDVAGRWALQRSGGKWIWRT